MRVVLDRTRGGSFLSSLMVGSGLMGMFLFLTYYFQENLGYSALKTGFAFLPFSAGIILAAGASSKMIPRTGPKPVMVAGFSAATLGMLWLTQIGAHTSSRPRAAGRDPDQPGHGTGLRPDEQHRAVRRRRPRCRCGQATLNTTQQIGGSLGTALLNTVFASTTAAYLATRVGTPAVHEAAQIHGYTVGFAIGAAFLVVAALSAAFLINATKEDMAETGHAGARPGLRGSGPAALITPMPSRNAAASKVAGTLDPGTGAVGAAQPDPVTGRL